jgi:hypothetical protein
VEPLSAARAVINKALCNAVDLVRADRDMPVIAVPPRETVNLGDESPAGFLSKSALCPA